MEFEIPNILDLGKRRQTTLIRAKEALEKHEPNRAVRLLQKATIKSGNDEIARDLMLAATLAHCNLPEKALHTVMNSLLQYSMSREQQLFFCIMEGELLSTLGKVRQAVKILDPCPAKAAALGRKDLAIEALIYEGGAYSIQGDQTSALAQLNQALSLGHGTSETRLLTRALAAKSVCLSRRGDLCASLKAAEEAVKTADKDDRFGQALGYHQIGVVHGMLLKFFESLEAHQNALRVFNELAHVPGQLREYLSLAKTYINMGDIGLATHFTAKAQTLAEDGDNPTMLALVYEGLGRLSLATGAISTAIERFGKQLDISEKQESDVVRARADRHMGIAEMFAGDLDKAFSHLYKAASRFRAAGDPINTRRALLDLYQLEPLLGGTHRKAISDLRLAAPLDIDKEAQEHPSTLAKKHFITAYGHLSRDAWADAMAYHDEGIEVLAHRGCFLEAALALYLFGKLTLGRNIEVACKILERALKLTDTYGFHDLTKVVLNTIGTIDGIGEEIVVEYSLDKAALRQLGDDADPRRFEAPFGTTNIIGDSPKLLEVLKELDRFAPTELPVLILGPSGTGKELVARKTHELSKRAAKPFVAINCATLPSGIIDAELFGGKKGAYSGLAMDRTGLILEANQGTLFLDEIGDFPIELQPKLLRFLQEGEVRPLGSDKTHTVDVRIIAATNTDLIKSIATGKFREDLYYRLSVVCLVLPSLAERGSDVLSIARYLIERFPLAKQKGVDGISRAAAAVLLDHTWPGNIRELVNVIQSAVVRAEGAQITTEDLRLNPLSSRSDNASTATPLPLRPDKPAEIKSRDEMMGDSIKRALESTNGNQSEAALLLNIHRNTLRNWMKRMKNEGLL